MFLYGFALFKLAALVPLSLISFWPLVSKAISPQLFGMGLLLPEWSPLLAFSVANEPNPTILS
jgi:hypothetical protein